MKKILLTLFLLIVVSKPVYSAGFDSVGAFDTVPFTISESGTIDTAAGWTDNDPNVSVTDITDNVGIGTVSPSQALDLIGSLELEDTTTSTTGVIYKGSDRFIHNFHHPIGGGALPDGNNVCIGIDAGNFTMGSTADTTAKSSDNIFIGYQAGQATTTGYQNSFIGTQTGYSNTIGFRNAFIGYQAGYNNTAADGNAFLGYNAGYNNTTGYSNTFFGSRSGYANLTGFGNMYLGATAGRYYNGTTGTNTDSDNCTLIGSNTSVSADGVEREVVLGYNAIGKGTDTVILGAEGVNTKVYASGGLVVNDDGADADSWIEGDADPYLTYWDADTGRVGIGTNTPGGLLHIFSDSAGTFTPHGNMDDLVIENSLHVGMSLVAPDDKQQQYAFACPSTTQAAGLRLTSYDSGLLKLFTSKVGGEIALSPGNFVEAVRLDASGNVGIGTTTPNSELDVDGIISGSTQTTTLGVAATTIAITTNFLVLTGDGGANTVATITGGASGQRLVILCTDANVTITDTAGHTANTVDLSAAFTSADDTILELIFDGTSWYEISRSVN